MLERAGITGVLNARKRILFLIMIMFAVCALVMTIMTVMLYRSEVRQVREVLQVSAQSQARMIEAVARNQIEEDVSLSNSDPDYNAFDATLEQVVAAHELYAGFGRTGEFTLGRREGDQIIFILRHRHSAIEKPAPVALDSGLAAPMRRALRRESGTMTGLDYRGELVLAAYEPVDVLGLGIVSKIDLSEVRAPFIRSVAISVVAALLVIVIGTGIFYRVGAPMVAHLELYARELEEEVRERRESEAFLDRIMQHSPFAMWVSDRHGLIIRTNRALHEILREPEENIVGKYNVLQDDNLTRHNLMSKVRAVYEEQIPCRFLLPWRGETLTKVKFEGNAEIVIDASFFPVLDRNGALTNVVCQWVDVSELKRTEQELAVYQRHLEELVKRRTDELALRVTEAEELNSAMVNVMEDLRMSNMRLEATGEALRMSNRELDAFSYSVSHDLRAPLRHIDGFVQLLLKRKADQLDSTSMRYLGTIKQSADRMGRLIDDLLALSRTGRKALRVQVMNSNEVVDEILEELSALMKGRKILWQVADLPEVVADRGLLRQVWQNLIGNAVKYTAEREEACIEIGCLYAEGEGSGEYEFHIRDNGVGFNPEYKHKLFGVFQRLHRDDEFDGNGIGLATVQRIIRKHGGRVWAEGEKDKGATFYFTLNRAPVPTGEVALDEDEQ